MLELMVVSLFTCEGAHDLIENVNRSQVEEKQEIIQVIKSNSESKCFKGGELNERSEHS